MHEPGARETALVETGTVTLVVDGARHELQAGDCVTFDADLPHTSRTPPRFKPCCWPSSPPGCAAHEPHAFDKIWEGHAGRAADLLYVDLHLVHEVTSPQAFDALRRRTARCAAPTARWPTADHNVAHRRTAASRIHDAYPVSRSRRSSELPTSSDPALQPGHRPPGDRPRHRPRAGRHPARHDDRLRRQPHRDPRRVRRAGLRHRHQRGRARARHPDAWCSASRSRCGSRTRGALGPGVTAKDLILATIGQSGSRAPPATCRIRGAGRPGALDGGPHDGLQHDDRGGGRAGMVAPDETTFAWLSERGVAVDEAWRELPTDPDAAFDTAWPSMQPRSARW